MKKKCNFCLKDFNALKSSTKYCSKICYSSDKNHPKNKINPERREDRICLICEKTFNVPKIKKNKLCSDDCRKKWALINKDKRILSSKKAVKEKYGVDNVFSLENVKEKIKNTNIEKYGVENPGKSLPIIEKIKSTNLERYGVTSHFKNEEIKEKIKNTNIKKYGVPYVLSSKEVRDKISKNIKHKNLEYYKEFYNLLGFEIIEYVGPQQKNKIKCLNCKKIFESTQIGENLIPNCKKCNPPKNDNKLTMLFEEILHDIGKIHFIKNDKFLIHPKEVDYVIEDKKICFEINGNFWHSELNGKDKNYHLNKTKSLFEKKYKLIHIFEDEFIIKYDILKSRIFNMFNKSKKIYARNCNIAEIDTITKKKFLNENHFQGDCKDSVRLGLFLGTELVSIMTFGKRKLNKNKSVEWELLRFSSINFKSVVGGFSKLLNFFIKNYQPKKIITYADIRWSGYDPKDTVYYKTGFNFINYTPPNYWYMKINNRFKRMHRFNFTKYKLLKEGYDKNLTEWDIMKLKGYDRIWDCGSMKFELIF